MAPTIPYVPTGAQIFSAIIDAGGSLSPAVDLIDTRLFGFQMPSAWTTAAMTFSVSADGVTYNDLYDDTGAEVNLTVSASKFIVLSNPQRFLGIRYIKVRSGTTGSAVNQAADRTIKLVAIS